MTAVLKVGSSALQNLQFGPNEIASSIVIGKHVGSIMSRSSDGHIIDVIEASYGVRVRRLPECLENVKFSREATVFGEKMRPLRDVKVMADLDIHQLQGFATFIVLCTRYVLPKEEIRDVIYRCFQGGIFGCVSCEELNNDPLPYSARVLILQFVNACIDTDADSKQSQHAKRWMAELASLAVLSFRNKEFPARGAKAVENLLYDLFHRGPQSVRVESNFTTPSFSQSNDRRVHDAVGGRVHDTMHINAAYVALAAAANGADIVVEAKTRKGSKMINRGHRTSSSTFIVRFWLTKPPEDVISILRLSSGDYLRNDEGLAGEIDNDPLKRINVFGGVREISMCAAQKLGYTGEDSRFDFETSVSALWNEGTKIAKQMRWTIVDKGNHLTISDELSLRLDATGMQIDLDRQAVPLKKALTAATQSFMPISTAVASAVHRIYCLSKYEVEQTNEYMAAMQLVLFAIGVETLHNMTHSSSDSKRNYALNIDSAVGYPAGDIITLVAQALDGREGTNHQSVLACASRLWGGATPESQGHIEPDASVMGIVAPHCTVIMDILRGPLEVTQDPLQAPLLMLCRGSVPMLPRNPKSGFVLVEPPSEERRKREREETEASAVNMGSATRRGGSLSGEIIITFEPVVWSILLLVWWKRDLRAQSVVRAPKLVSYAGSDQHRHH